MDFSLNIVSVRFIHIDEMAGLLAVLMNIPEYIYLLSVDIWDVFSLELLGEKMAL